MGDGAESTVKLPRGCAKVLFTVEGSMSIVGASQSLSAAMILQ